jgi:dipeptidyl aminopeptidase/acylaminoacyl peptidase
MESLARFLGRRYFLAVEPAPVGDCVAAAVINGGSIQGATSILLLSPVGEVLEELHIFDLLMPVKIRWDQTGQTLAFSQDNVLFRVQPGGRLRRDQFTDAVRWIGFDASGQCWCLSGTKLMVAPTQNVSLETHRVDVLAADAAAGIAVVTNRDRGLELAWSLGDDRYHSARWPLEVTDKPSLRWNRDCSSIVVAAQRWQAKARIHAQIAVVDLAAGTRAQIFDRTVAVGIAAPGFAWAPIADSKVAVLADLGDTVRLWEAGQGNWPNLVPLSDNGDEIASFAVHPDADAVALVASGTHTAQAAVQRRLLVGHSVGGRWQLIEIEGGVNDLPAWAAGSQALYFVHGHQGTYDWDLRCYRLLVDRPGPPGAAEPGSPYRCRQTIVAGVASEIVELTVSGSRHTGVVYVQGPHRQFIAGPQTSFFHYALCCLMQSLASVGHYVVAVNGPGSIGRGTARREPDGYFRDHGAAAIDAGVKYVRAQGCKRYAVLAGSLGAMAVLQFLANRQDCAAAALVSPAYVPDLVPLHSWQFLFTAPQYNVSSSLSGIDVTLEKLAAPIVTPIFVVHGLRDEISPAQHTSAFLARLPPTTPSSYHVLTDETHIFRRWDSWLMALKSIGKFLNEALEQSTDRVLRP